LPSRAGSRLPRKLTIARSEVVEVGAVSVEGGCGVPGEDASNHPSYRVWHTLSISGDETEISSRLDK